MRYPIRPNMDWRHYRTPRSIEGYYPEVPRSPGWQWVVCGLLLGAVLLALILQCL